MLPDVAGIIAARGYNGMGVRGVAPWARIYSLNLLADIRPRMGGGSFSFIRTNDLLDAMQRDREITAVSNNSWGPTESFQPANNTRRMMWEGSINNGIS